MADNSPQVQAAQLRQQQANAYAQAQQPAWMSAAAPAQLKPTGDPTDEEVVDKLNALSRGEEVEGDSMAIEDLAVERADAKYEKATGEKNFAHNLMNDMKPMLKSAFDSIKEGHKDAIDVIENNKRNEEQQKQQAVAAIFAFSSVVLAWAPVVSAAVAGLEASFLKTMQQSFPTMTSDNINLKTHLKLIKKFGESKVPIALNTTAKEAYTLTKTVSSGSAEVLGKQTDTLRQKVEHASYASMLEAAMNLEKGSGKASPEEIAALRT